MKTSSSKILLTSVWLVYFTYGMVNAQEGGLGPKIDLSKPPKHLQKSMLIQFLSKRKASNIPYPFPQLSRELIYESYSPVGLYVPRGRSLQRAATDEFLPRRVIAPFTANKIASRIPIGFENESAYQGSEYEGRLFFGYAEQDNRMEIISWNPESGRFDFFLADNYPASFEQPLVPEVREVKARSICLSCHQSGGPIFPPQPWTEMVTHDPIEFFHNDSQPQTYKEAPTLYRKDGLLLTKELTPFFNNAGLSVGTSVMVGNRLLQGSQMVRQLCGRNTQCRRLLLLAALSNPNQSKFIRDPANLSDPSNPLSLSFEPAYEYLKSLEVPRYFDLKQRRRVIENLWPPNEFAYTNEFIPDLTSVADGSSNFQESDPRFSRDAQRGVPMNSALAYIYDVAYESLGFSLVQSREIKQYNPDLVTRLFSEGFAPEEAEAEVEKLLAAWPPQPESVLTLIRKYLRPGELEFVNDYESEELPLEAEATDFVDTGATPAELFVTFCARCHAGPSALTDVPVDNPAQLLAWNQENGGVVNTRLGDRSMPPSDQDGVLLPSDAQRSAMLAYLKGGLSNQDIGQDRSYYNHLQVRVTERQKLMFSFIVPNRSVRTGDAFYLSPSRLRAEPRIGPYSYLAAQGSDRKIYYALENFPEFSPGNIVQVLPLSFIRNDGQYRLERDRLPYRRNDSSDIHQSRLHRDQLDRDYRDFNRDRNRYEEHEYGRDRFEERRYSRELESTLVGVRRGGSLTYLEYDDRLQRQVSRPVKLSHSINVAYIAEGVYRDGILVLDRQQRMYRGRFKTNFENNRSNLTLDLSPLRIRNGADFVWTRIHSEDSRYLLLETVEGEMVQATLQGDEIVVQSIGGTSPVVNRRDVNARSNLSDNFVPSLNDRTSLMLVPADFIGGIGDKDDFAEESPETLVIRTGKTLNARVNGSSSTQISFDPGFSAVIDPKTGDLNLGGSLKINSGSNRDIQVAFKVKILDGSQTLAIVTMPAVTVSPSDDYVEVEVRLSQNQLNLIQKSRSGNLSLSLTGSQFNY